MRNWKNWLKEFAGLALYFIIIFVVVFVLTRFVVQKIQVDGPSMKPTLKNEEQVLVNKLAFKFSDAKRYDIVPFHYQYEEDTDYIKRVIGLPGETIRIDEEGNIWINDEILEEPYEFDVMTDPGIAATPITLGKDEYFVLGDNRENSIDSRDPSVGVVKESWMVGRVWLRVSPLKKFGFVD